ncbi:hypothetical protein IMZ08_00170 [Bacillus luteolus]|uniref:Uncharacterized protein n=1 Tax=Litchfieldia luteola TaxID=682179 RepID=A0ABR9QD98_9BACI|nr:hypothetical protein [Cytobacillus luteolus]MBE4906469.1 hypothetical protein [Cytobacillus luteolus]MBP1941152.1 uncharacterized protein YfbU (UPF0304 family) [Cytobacillus luteolus]
MYSLYALCIFGISLNQVKNLVRAGFTLRDFEEKTLSVMELGVHKPALVETIIKIIPNIRKEDKEDNLYQLANEGLSGTIINNLIDLNISYHDLNILTLERFNELTGGNRKSAFTKIITAFEIVETSKGRVPYRKVRKSIIEIVTNLKLDEAIKVDKVQETLFSEYRIKVNDDNLESILQDMLNNNYIGYNSLGIKRYYPSLMDYLKGEFKDKEIFIKRLQGKTLAELGNEFQYSRQGVRNIEVRVINSMPVFVEDIRYRVDFEKYNFPKDLFCSIFEEQIEVYYYLNLKYVKGNQSVINDFFNIKFSESQRKQLLKYFNCFLSRKGEIKELSKMSIFEEVVSKYALEAVTDDEIVEKYNEYIIKNNLPKSYQSDESSLRGISDRCQNVIRGKGSTYRYYDFEVLTNHVINQLKEHLELASGVYSMKKIFRENPELMEEVDIRTEYELHNLYRRTIEVDNVYYTRMPEFTIEKIDKKEFFIGLFKEYSPIPLKEFVEYIEEVYGLRQDSLSSYITGFLNEYLYEDIIKTDYIELSDVEIAKLKSLLTKPIYTFEEVKKIGRSILDDFDERFLNNMTLSKVGYQIKSNFILSDSYNSLDDYFRRMILSNDYFVNEHLDVYRTQTFGSVIYNLEKNYEIFKVEKDTYITFKKLTEAGVTVNDILDYKRVLIDFIKSDENKYFTLHSIREEGFDHPLNNLGFSEIFYERIIWTFEGFRAIQAASTYIFKKTNSILSLREFLYDYISDKRVIKLEELIEDMVEVYGIILEASKVVYLLGQTDVFYSEELYKFYIDKEDFYEEVY